MNRKFIIAAILILIIPVFALMAFAAEDDFLSPKGNTGKEIQPGEKIKFSVNLEQLTPEEDPEMYGNYTIVFEVFAVDEEKSTEDQVVRKEDAPPMYWDVKENVKIEANYVKDTYSAKYTSVENLKALNFFAMADDDLELAKDESYLYMVNVKVLAGPESAIEDVPALEEWFTFRLIPKEEPTEPTTEPTKPTETSTAKPTEPTTTTAATKPSKPKHGGFDGGEEEDDKDAYHGSSDNYLRELSVSGQELTQTFHKTRMVYFVDLTEDVSSLDVHAVPCDKGARVDIAGNNNLRDGSGKIVIDVRAVNGDKRTYTIYVRRK